jgi:hypothetical protein
MSKRGRGIALLEKALISSDVENPQQEIKVDAPMKKLKVEINKETGNENPISTAISTTQVFSDFSEERIIELFKALLITYSYLKSKRQPTLFNS